MKTALIVMGIILAVLILVFIVLSIVGKKLQTKQEASQAQMKEASQIASILVIDKKRMKLKEAGLPKMIVDNTPKYLRGSKIPVVKAKIGPKIMTLMCDEKIFDLIPIKKEVKAIMNGIYLIDVKGLRGGLDQKPVKQSWLKRTRAKLQKKVDDNTSDTKQKKAKA